MRRFKSIYVLPIILAIILLLGFQLITGCSAPESTDDSGGGGTSSIASSSSSIASSSSSVESSSSVASSSSSAGPLGPGLVNLGTADNYIILAKSGISTVPPSVIMGNIGISPIDAAGLTGFDPITLDSSGIYGTASQVTPPFKIYAADYAEPTPANLTTAVLDMQAAYTDAAGRTTPDFTNLGDGNITGLTLAPGLYKWTSGLLINGNVTLSGNATDTWIFQIATDFTMGPGATVTLTGGAIPSNVVWQSFGVVALDTTAHIEGVVLSQSSITLNAGATAKGRLYAQTAVTLQSSTVNP